MRFWGLLFWILAFAGQSHALSCVQPNIAQEFNWRQDDEAIYQVFIGQIEIVGTIPKYREGIPRTAKGIASGRFMGRSKLGSLQQIGLTIHATCAASWCGGFPPKMTQDSAFFFKKSDTGYELYIGPCDLNIGHPIRKDDIDILHRCFQKGRCSEKDINQLYKR